MTLIYFQGHFGYYRRFHCLYLKNTPYIMYEVSYNAQTSYLSNYLCCQIQSEGLSWTDRLAIVKFLDIIGIMCNDGWIWNWTVRLSCQMPPLWTCEQRKHAHMRFWGENKLFALGLPRLSSLQTPSFNDGQQPSQRHLCSCSLKAAFHYSSKLQTWLSTGVSVKVLDAHQYFRCLI